MTAGKSDILDVRKNNIYIYIYWYTVYNLIPYINIIYKKDHQEHHLTCMTPKVKMGGF